MQIDVAKLERQKVTENTKMNVTWQLAKTISCDLESMKHPMQRTTAVEDTDKFKRT